MPGSAHVNRCNNKLTTTMIAFTEKFTHLGKIARRYTLIVDHVIVLGLASSEDLCVPVFSRVDML